jgi:hypothetical protein
MMRRQLISIVIFLGVALIFVSISSAAFVLRKGGKTYIEDQKGERWDVTQAKSIGFKPELFQYGIGKNAFTPLDDSNLSDNTSSVTSNLRVIGVSDGSEAQAYSIPKLKYHEIANTKIGAQPIVAGY